MALLRTVCTGLNQTAFAHSIGIEVRRWNNFERGSPLSKEVAILLVRRFPGVTMDWLFLGNEQGLPIRLQREFAEAGKGNTSALPSKTGAR